VSVAKIKEASSLKSNNIKVGDVASSLKSNNIKVGDVLLIPGTHKTPLSSTYTVVSGDTLGGIGNKFNVSVKELKNANNLKNSNIRVGMKLTVSGNSKPAQPRVQTAKKAARKPNARYIVKSGESLGIIAQRYGVSVTSIVNANNLKGHTIRAGQTINIPSTENYRDYARNTEYSSNNESPSYKKTKENIITVAKRYLGAPYKFGGYSFKTGIDCSGYVKKIFSKFNVELPRTARDIYYNAGTRVAKSQLQTGDLVFFRTYASYPSHVGIYMGNGQFIHASSGAHKVSITSLNKNYYTKRYIGAKRIQLSAIFEDEYSQR